MNTSSFYHLCDLFFFASVCIINDLYEHMYNTYQRAFFELNLFNGATHPLIAGRRFNCSQVAHIPCVLLLDG